MRLLIDREGLGWDQAWRITTASTGYTNHTILPEALEKWPVKMLGAIAPPAFADHLRDQCPVHAGCRHALALAG